MNDDEMYVDLEMKTLFCIYEGEKNLKPKLPGQ